MPPSVESDFQYGWHESTRKTVSRWSSLSRTMSAELNTGLHVSVVRVLIVGSRAAVVWCPPFSLTILARPFPVQSLERFIVPISSRPACQNSQRLTKGQVNLPCLRSDDLLKLPVYPSVSRSEGRQVLVGAVDLLAHMV